MKLRLKSRCKPSQVPTETAPKLTFEGSQRNPHSPNQTDISDYGPGGGGGGGWAQVELTDALCRLKFA